MQNFVIFYKSSLVYLVGARIGTNIFGEPALLDIVGVPCIKFASSSRLLCWIEPC